VEDDDIERKRALHRERDARYRAAHPERMRERKARYRTEHAERERAHAAQYREAHHEQLRARKNRQYAENRDAILARKRASDSKPSVRMRRLVDSARTRMLRDGGEFDPGLRAALIADPPTACACCGALLDYSMGRGPDRARSPSLDRIDNTRGYTLENVAVICFRCNRVKGSSSLARLEVRLAELETIIDYVKRHHQ
jgi:hypothetical protein